ncbi:MAG TPA: NAD(P)-binding domain-containing protein, partial [Flavobacterium sp.]|nr:NAD(P)-binding domain-containing protein [Flavobacterium sp.]
MKTTNTIGILGIGKLGLCFALNLEKSGFNVIGVDVNEDYVSAINSKTLQSPEPFVEDYLKKSKKFTASTRIQDIIG